MGLLRIYLAICVVAGHANFGFPWENHGGKDAVQIFYLISGFYMAHIAGKYRSTVEFYLSRFFRIFPPYYVVLIFSVIIIITSGLIYGFWGRAGAYVLDPMQNGFTGIAAAMLSNFTLFFQDSIRFLKHDVGGSFSFTSNFLENKMPLKNYLIVPQAWTIGVELVFYVFVPFLNKRKTKVLIGVLLASFFARVIAYEFLGLNHDPWTYRFFPFELGIFVFGILSHRFYVYMQEKNVCRYIPEIKNMSQYIILSFFCFIFFCLAASGVGFASMYLNYDYGAHLSYCVWFFVIPVLFHASKMCKLDRYIGNLSYPIYLGHIIVIDYVKEIFSVYEIDLQYCGIVSVVTTIILSTILYRFVIVPIDNRRYKLSRSISDKMLRLK